MAVGDNQEIEVKFFVKNFKVIKQRLRQFGAKISLPRSFEINYRYDTPDSKLSAESKVLRIRQDTKNWITFKGPGEIIDGIRIRQEIEISISDINNAHLFLQALGYEIYQSYEKYRSVYILNNSHVMLDELPFGTFVEIEGADLVSIKTCAETLGLQWEANIESGYLAIYKKLCSKLDMDFGNLSFKEFAGNPEMLSKINIIPAD
jgi:adenylate cyclase class 2